MNDSAPLNKSRCRRCRCEYYAAELVAGVCNDCRWKIKRKDRYDEQRDNNERKERE